MNDINKEKQANELMVNAIYKALKRANIPVIKASDDLAEILQFAGMQVAYKKKEAPETVSVSDKKHHQTVISSADGANILKNIDKLITEYQKDFKTKEKTFIGNVAKTIGAKRDGSGSEYATFITQNNKTITIRLSNHNATISNFDYRNEDNGISIVITSKENKKMNKGGNAHVVEFYYDSIKLRKAFGQPLVEILQSLKQALLTGEYKDTTGLAQREEVNATFLKDKTGTIYGWTSNANIYLTKDGMNPRTLLHEYTHLWSNAMQIANPEGWQSIKDIMREDPLWYKVQSDSNYADIADDEDMLVSEVLSRRSERNNVALLATQAQKVLREGAHDKDYQANQLLFKVKEGLNMFWDWVTTKLFSMKRFQSEEQVSNRILYDLVNSTPLPQDKMLHNKTQFSISQAGRFSDISIYSRSNGDYMIRCKMDGVQQMGRPVKLEDKKAYLNCKNLKEMENLLAVKYFANENPEDRDLNKSFKR